MDSPDRMSWTPSSSAKKRKYSDFIDTWINIPIPGAFPQSPEYNSFQHMLSPSPSPTLGVVRPGLAAQVHAPMLDLSNLPEPFRRLYEMAANTRTKAHAMSSSAFGFLAGSSRQAIRYFSDNFGPLYAAVETFGNAAKRIKLSIYPPPIEAETPSPPSTPPHRISNLMNRTPTPAFPTQTSILRNARERDIRKVRKTLRWVEEQEAVSEASKDMIQQQISQSPFEPVMSGALPSDSTTDDLDTAVFDDADDTATSSSSEVSDSVTSSMAEGLDAEDLEGIETREEKKLRKKREAIKKPAAPSQFASQLRAIHHTSPPTSKPLAQRVMFYDSPTSGRPVTLVKEYSSEDALTPPIRPHSAIVDIRSRPALKARSVSRGLPKPPAKDGKSLHRLLNTAAVSPPVTPEAVGRDLSNLGVSHRRSSTRLDQLAIQAQQERDAEAAAAAQRAAEDAEERTRLGVRRMPTGPVILPLTEEWDNKVNAAMGKRTEVEVAKTSLGDIITRRDFGRVLPVRGVDPASGWLNDAIISAYLQAAVDYGQKMRGVKRGSFPKVHAFNTFFYNNLSTKGYNSVRRWATKAKFGGKDILKMEKIFIPINLGGNHWVLAHVNPQTKTIEYFDSFHAPGSRIVDNIKTWLAAELRDAFVDAEWTVVEKQGPEQYNASDCGVFCATTAKMIVLGVDPMAFSAADMATQRRVMLAELMNGGFEGDFTPNISF
ncbi:MAG: hypothetical protein LQ345_002749 [Seirophora villosa]|nr:MAG: hypothetical protein LQ345_002749 [Seirophora villosa]